MLDYGVVQENLLVGSCPHSRRDLLALRKKLKVSAILCLQDDLDLTMMGLQYADLQKEGQKLQLIMVRYQWPDTGNANPRSSRLGHAVDLLRELVNAGHKVYIHCTLGRVRSPTVVLAYLTGIQGFALADAIALIRQARPQATPLMHAYEAYQAEMRQGEMSDQVAPMQHAVCQNREYF